MDEDFPFDCFEPEAIKFLKQLKKNNDRDWFNANKQKYDIYVKAAAEGFCREAVPLLTEMTGTPHMSKIFRVYRDVRFSKDKRPYNAHLHIMFRPIEERVNRPGWFFGLQPDGLFFGCGVFDMAKTSLDTYRARVAGPDGADMQKILKSFDRKGLRVGAPDLVRVPTQYDKDHPHGDLLRRKSLTAWVDHKVPDAALDMAFMKTCKREFKKLKPMYDWFMDG